MQVRKLLAILTIGLFVASHTETTPTANAQTEQPATGQSTPPIQDANQKRAIETLTRELGEMVPGGIDATPERKTAIDSILSSFVAGEGAKSLELIKALAETDPTFPPAELVIASLQFSANNPNSGRQTMEKAAIEYPDYPGVFLALARLAINENRNADGLSHLEKAERLMNGGQWSESEKEHFRLKHVDALADVMIRYQKWDDAMPLLAEIEKATPQDPKLLVRQAEIMYRKEKHAEAIELLGQFTAAVKQNGSDKTRRPELMLATWFNRDGDTDSAHKWIITANEKYPEDVDVTAEYADWMVGRQRFADAKIAIKKIVDAKGETIATKFIKGKIAFAEENYGLAEAHFSELTLKEPGNFELANLWALSLVELGSEQKVKTAVQVAQRNVQVQPKNGVALGILGWIYYKVGDTRQAQTWLNRATQTGVKSAEVSYFIAKILSDQGQKEQAQALVTGALEQKGVFLYRTAAKRLSAELNAEKSKQDLPDPDKK
jgi:Flp pilus assembly protein TadD